MKRLSMPCCGGLPGVLLFFAGSCRREKGRRQAGRLGAAIQRQGFDGVETQSRPAQQGLALKDGILYSKGKEVSHLSAPATIMKISTIASRPRSRQGQQRPVFSHAVGGGYPKATKPDQQQFPRSAKNRSLYNSPRSPRMLVPPVPGHAEVIANGTTQISSTTKVVDFEDKKNTHSRPFRHSAARSSQGRPDVEVALRKSR